MRGHAQPAFRKVHRVPYALKEQVENELDKLEKHGVIKKTNRSCWASATVATKKLITLLEFAETIRLKIRLKEAKNKFE